MCIMRDDAYVSSSSPGGGSNRTSEDVTTLCLVDGGTAGEVCRLRLHLVLIWSLRCVRCAGGLCCGTAAGGSEASLGSIYPGGAGPVGMEESYSMTGAGDDLRDLFLLCPKCVLLRHAHPGRSFAR